MPWGELYTQPYRDVTLRLTLFEKLESCLWLPSAPKDPDIWDLLYLSVHVLGHSVSRQMTAWRHEPDSQFALRLMASHLNLAVFTGKPPASALDQCASDEMSQ